MINQRSRTKNSIMNILVGVGSQVIILILTFISRTIFINTLGAEYLGVNGLYTNILTVLSLAELGIGNVMIYSLYKPMAENNIDKIRSLLGYYRSLYSKISISIFSIGLFIVPFLGNIVNSDLDHDKLILYYVFFLANTAISYLVVYKTILINADQKNRIVRLVYTATVILRELIQIIVLIFFQNYLLFLFVMILSTVANNLVISSKANSLYPFIKKIESKKEKSNEIHEINQNIKSAFVYKIGAVLMNNTDNILISIILGTVFVGYYSNYSMIVLAVQAIIGILIQAIFSSVGNLNAKEDKQKSFDFFNVLLFFFHFLTAVCSICFLLIFNDFIITWIGSEYVLELNVVVAISFNFYIQNIINPVWIYRETLGLFKDVKKLMLFAAFVNLLLSVVFGFLFGLSGIIVSTALARIVTTVWFEPKILYRKVFEISVRQYWKRQLKYLFLTVCAAALSYYLTLGLSTSILTIIIKIIITLLVTCLIFVLTSYKTKEFRILTNYALKLNPIKKFKRK